MSAYRKCINATSLVAVLSVAGLALSLSVQNLLTNFFSGIMLLINKPFKEGDFVEVGDKVGLFFGPDDIHVMHKEEGRV